MKISKILIYCIVLIFFSCRKDIPEKKAETPPPPAVTQAQGVLVLNEGTFKYGNASVSYFKFSDGTVTEDLFKPANSRPLGDVGQSMCLFKGKYYIVVNNSGTIEIVNPSDFKTTGTISGLISPRYFAAVDSSKAYVTDFKSNTISVINLNSNTKVKDIACPGWTEELLVMNGKAYVTNLRREYVYIINTTTDNIEDSIKTGYASNSLRADKDGKLWVLCEGSSTKGFVASLHRLNPVTRKVEFSLQFVNTDDTPGHLEINGTKEILYYVNNGVWEFPIGASSLPPAPLITKSNGVIYGLGVEPSTGIIYISDAIDYVQKGKVYRYKPDGTLIGSFATGINPNHFIFY